MMILRVVEEPMIASNVSNCKMSKQEKNKEIF